jgi:hypothetical protein
MVYNKLLFESCSRQRPLLITALLCFALVLWFLGTSEKNVANLQERSFQAALAIRSAFQKHEQACPAWFSGMYEDLAPWRVRFGMLCTDCMNRIQSSLRVTCVCCYLVGAGDSMYSSDAPLSMTTELVAVSDDPLERKT